MEELQSLILSLDGVRQDPRFHPEGDALEHTLQTFEQAFRETDDPVLLAAALFHDVGKALGSVDHDETGADLLDGLIAPGVVWLVRHHLDLLRNPGATRRRLRGTAALHDLERLRRWDLAGRSRKPTPMTVQRALTLLFQSGARDLDPSSTAHPPYDHHERNDLRG